MSISSWLRFGSVVFSVATLLVTIPNISVGQRGSQSTAAYELSNKLDSQTKAKLIPILNRASDRGLPVKALTAKAAEGVLRGRSGASIVTAVQALEERLTTSQVALAPSSPADVIAGADALAVGVDVGVLREVKRQVPNAPIAVPLAVLAHLVSQKIPQARAAEIVFELLKLGVSPEQLLAIREGVNNDVLSGKSAMRSLDARAATVLATLSRDGHTGSGVAASAALGGGLEAYSEKIGASKKRK